jgi:hypothetical protein
MMTRAGYKLEGNVTDAQLEALNAVKPLAAKTVQAYAPLDMDKKPRDKIV